MRERTSHVAERKAAAPLWARRRPAPSRARPAIVRAGLVVATSAASAVAASAGPALATVGRGHTTIGTSLLARPAATRPGWSVVPAPNAKAPTGQLLFGTCTSASSCEAVGTHVTASGLGVTLAERWNGTRWAIQRTPNPAGARVSALNGVSCSASRSCTAVGNLVTSGGRQLPFAERWNGTRWRLEPMPAPAGSRQAIPIAVACRSASSCAAVGFSVNRSGAQLSLAERWNGTRWRIQGTPRLAGAAFTFLDDVSCTIPSACTAVGQTSKGTLAERWNGTRWRVQSTPNPAQGGGGLLGVACTSRSSCTAAGLSNAGTLAERWNGTRWRIQSTPNPAGSQFIFLNGVGCSSPSACTAVGAYIKKSGDFRPVAERWNGIRWTIQRTPSPGGAQGDFLAAVSCPARLACTALGFSHGSGTPLAMAQRWNGSSWRVQRTPSPAGAAESQLSGVACTSPSACIGVGTGANKALAERWNGTRWSTQPIPTVAGASLSAVSCTSPSACIAVGMSPSGTLAERWNGTRWTIQPIPNPAGAHGSGLLGISCTSASDCMAAGAYFTTASQSSPVRPLTERWNGTRWTILTTPNPVGSVQTFLGGISCTSPSACTAVGEQHSASGIARTAAERWNGTAWTVQPTPNPSGTQSAIFSGVNCTAPSACLAVGGSDQGTLAERWNGSAWTIDPTPNPPGGGQLNGVSCRGASACTAIGFTFTSAGGMLLAERWNGTTWSIQPTPLIPAAHDMGLPAIACVTKSWCTAVGGDENDGPGSVTLAELWRGGTAAFAPRPAVSSAGPDRTCALPLLVAADIHAAARPTPPGWPAYRTAIPAGNRATPSAPPFHTWC